jgi:hypothetical protein
MSNKTKYYVIGTLAAAIGGFFIQGVSDTGVAYTGSKEGFRSVIQRRWWCSHGGIWQHGSS